MCYVITYLFMQNAISTSLRSGFINEFIGLATLNFQFNILGIL